jgi:hypothetical protein
MENHSKYSRNIYYHGDKELYVVQFIASELSWKEKGIKITQLTSFPEEETVRFEIEAEKPLRFGFNIRYPFWARKGIQVLVNGRELEIDQEPGSFVNIQRKWKAGDRVELRMPFSLRIEAMPDNQNRVAIFNGPVVLAGDLGPVPDPRSKDLNYVPVLMTEERDPSEWLIPVEGKFNSFVLSDVAYPRKVELAPFYRTHDRHYTIFWDTFNEEQWKAFQEAYTEELKRKKQLEDNTIDLFRIGEMQPERDHQFVEKDTWVEEYRGRKARTADRGGWFAFQMDVRSPDPVSLSVEYWGGYTGSKTFDILVEDQVIATENITNKAPGKFIDVSYRIPGELLVKKEKVEVKFLPQVGHRAGPVFTVRTIREKQEGNLTH